MRSRLSLLAAVTLLAAVPALAEKRRAIDLPPGTLGNAIIALSRLTGASVRLSDPRLWARATPAVHGKLTVREALDRLLVDMHAQPIALGDGHWQIAPAVEQILPAPVVTPGTAQASPAIIVTASKRGTRLSDYPGTVTMIAGLDLNRSGPADSGAIADRVASVTSTHLGNGRDKLFIRGIADSGLVGQSQATAGQYLGDIRISYNAPDPDLKLYDIASVEVLEGPQGTLYGAGSPGGIVRIVSNPPAPGRLEASGTAGISTVAHGASGADGSAMLNLPIDDDHIALRVVGYAESDGGYIDNIVTHRDNVNRVRTVGGRAALRIDPGDGWTIDAGGTLQNIHGSDAQYADRNGPPLTRASPLALPYDDDYRMAQLTITKDISGLRFTSSNAFVRQYLSERFDATVLADQPQLLRQWNRTTMFTTENRLARPMADGFGWVMGTSFLHNAARLTRGLGEDGPAFLSTDLINHISETTAFGEMSVEPVRDLTLTAGGRITHSRLSGNVPAAAASFVQFDRVTQGGSAETKLLPSLAASVRPLPGLILFSRYQQGFRPGGLAVGNGIANRFRSDRVATTEIGARYGGPGSSALSLALSIAYTDWRDIQADFLDSTGLPVTTNIGDGRIWSFGARGAWRPIPALRIEASFQVNNGRLTRPDDVQLRVIQLPTFAQIVRQGLPNVAQFGGRVGASYQRAMAGGFDLSIDGWARYVGKSRLGVGPALGGKEGNYFDTALSARLGHGRYGVTLSATNLLDTAGNRYALGTPLNVVTGNEITPLQPRAIRLGFDFRF